MLKILGRTNSINVQKVMWTVAELGLPHERVDAGMAHGVVNEPWYADLNPNRLVPAIDDDGVVLWESNVIVRYLAAKHAAGTLMPADRRAARQGRDVDGLAADLASRLRPAVSRADPHAAREARHGGDPRRPGEHGRRAAPARQISGATAPG